MLNIASLPEGLNVSDWFVWVATWFGAGMVIPLRAGLAVASVWLVLLLPIRVGRLFWLATFAVLSIAGFIASEAWEMASGVYDDRLIVIDEVAAFAVLMAVIGAARWWTGGLAAIAFLALDKLKPWPVDRLEALPGGLGVMADDVAPGLFVGVVVLLVRYVAYRRRIGPTSPPS